MASILALKGRIKAAQNVSKTTMALQMISASKMKKAQNAVIATRPYVNKLQEISGLIGASSKENYTHPYLTPRKSTGKTLLLAFSPDKGLCGGLVTNLIREFLLFKKSTEKDIQYIVVGKKLEGRIIQVSREIIASFSFGSTVPDFQMVYPLIQLIDEYYINQKVDSVKVLMTEYKGVFMQSPKIKTILPIEFPAEEKTPESVYTAFEPSKDLILNSLLTHYLQMTIYLFLIESFVSEQAARMIAMQNATSNAHDIIDTLEMEYNKTRQAKITSEILDISSSAMTKRME